MGSNETRLIFIIQAHAGMTPQGKLSDVCTLDLRAKTVDEALARARKIIKKKEYRVTSIIEQSIDK